MFLEELHTHSSRPEIVTLLLQLRQARALISVTPAGSKATLYGHVETVEPWGSHFVMSCNGTHGQICQALTSDSLVFAVRHETAKIQFIISTKDIQAKLGERTLTVNVPKTLMRFDRRKNYRVALRPSDAVRCSIPISDSLDGQFYVSEVNDLSTGGASLSFSNAKLEVKPGTLFSNCRLSLPKLATLPVNVMVRHTWDGKDEKGERVVRAGCQFVDLPISGQATVLRYITTTELERSGCLPTVDAAALPHLAVSGRHRAVRSH